MKSKKVRVFGFLAAAIVFYIAAMIDFMSEDDHSMAVVWFCLGSSFLCLSGADGGCKGDKKGNTKN